MKKYDYYMSVGQFALWCVLMISGTIECVAQIAMLPQNEAFDTLGKIILAVLFLALLALVFAGGRLAYKEMKQAKKSLCTLLD